MVQWIKHLQNNMGKTRAIIIAQPGLMVGRHTSIQTGWVVEYETHYRLNYGTFAGFNKVQQYQCISVGLNFIVFEAYEIVTVSAKTDHVWT